jgi:ABC-type Mn2+/Zn2+ transport system permease subunit
MSAPTKPIASKHANAWLGPLVYTLLVAIVAGIWLSQSTNRLDLAPALGTMAVGIVVNACCAILGCYLVLRRMSLLGDAISHAVLPGIALAYLFSGQVYGWPILLGAMAVGVLTTMLTQGLHHLGKVNEDAGMGVIFTSLFAAGVIMIEAWGRGADLDVDCVLYGAIDTVGIDLRNVGGLEVPRALLSLLPALVLVLIYVAVLWKELKIVSFDPALASAMGLSAVLVHYSLMAMVACVTVASFEAVGSIVVVAMIVVPAATGALLSERLLGMMVWSVAIGAASAVFGYLAAAAINTNVAGMMAVMAGLQMTVAVVLAPRSGLASRWLRNLELALRIAREDQLARLYRREEAGPAQPGPVLHPAGWLERLAVWQLRRRQLIAAAAKSGWRLTDSGRGAARNVVRAHRLWETYLETHFDLPADHLHAPAERMEHFLDPALQAELDAELAGRRIDPHGKEIPQ